MNQPKYFKTITDLLNSAIDTPERRVKKMQIITESERFHPYSIHNKSLCGVTQGDFNKEIKYIHNTALQLANDDATAKDLEHKWQTAGFMLLTALCVFMVLLMGLIAMTTVYGG